MNKSIVAVIVVLGVAVAAGGGYWFGQQRLVAGGASGKAQIVGCERSRDRGQGFGRRSGGHGGSHHCGDGADAANDHGRGKPALRRIGHVASGGRGPRQRDRISRRGNRWPRASTLVKLDPAINEAEVLQAKANLTLASSKYERAIDLQKQGFISGQAKDEAENNLKVAEAAVALAAARLAKTEIRAPFAGLIGLRSISVGDYVKEGQDMVNLEAIDPLKVDFRVPEIYLKQVQVGQKLEVTLDALPGRKYEGMVSAINPLVDAAGRAIVIRAQVRNADTALRPGMFARVRLLTKDERDALVLPEQALVPQGEEQYVFRIVDGKASRTKVETGPAPRRARRGRQGRRARRDDRHRRPVEASRRHVR